MERIDQTMKDGDRFLAKRLIDECDTYRPDHFTLLGQAIMGQCLTLAPAIHSESIRLEDTRPQDKPVVYRN